MDTPHALRDTLHSIIVRNATDEYMERREALASEHGMSPSDLDALYRAARNADRQRAYEAEERAQRNLAEARAAAKANPAAWRRHNHEEE